MRVFLLSLLCLFLFETAYSQEYKISGYIKDASNGQTLPGASVYMDENHQGSATDVNGYYSFTVPAGNYHLHVSILSYSDTVIPIKVSDNLHISVNIIPTTVNTQAVDVTADRPDKNVESSQMGTVTLAIKDLKTIPVFFGEPDILKMIQLLPGVQTGGDANTGFYVRGGGPDENLVLLDGATVYNVGHLLGFFSIFNSDALSSVELIKGNMPANYGGRISSVLDIKSKNGDMDNIHVDGGIGLIASHITVQGPIKKDKISFIFSARRTYIDAFLREPLISTSSPFYGTSYYFYDLNGKIDWNISQKDNITISGYFGQDVFNFTDAQAGFSAQVPWGNAIAAINWSHIYSDKVISTLTLDYTDYNFKFNGSDDGFSFSLFSGIHDYHLKYNFDFIPNKKHHIKYGLEYTLHVFIPSEIAADEPSVNFSISDIQKLYSNEGGAYITDEWDISQRIKVEGGLRYSIFQQIGPFDRYLQNNQGVNYDTIKYKTLQNIALYGGFEPRISFRYRLNDESSIKLGYSRNIQYIHLASVSSVSLPTDIWFPSTSIVQPTTGDQYALGYYRNFANNMYESSVETYYKNMQNLIEYKNGVTPEDNPAGNPDEDFTFGSGQAYGIEFYLKKKAGKFNGWIGYTLSWTTETFADLNNGQTFYAKYDRRNDISAVANYQLNDRWTFSSVFVFSSGEALTLPVGWYIIEGNLVQEYGAINNYRLIPYDRLDLAATYTPDRKKRLEKRQQRWENKMAKQGIDAPYVDNRPAWKKNFKTSWTFSIYNVYDRYNPYFIYFDINGNVYNNSLTIQAKQVSLFPVLPSVMWNFEF
jgi:hypothetical protein